MEEIDYIKQTVNTQASTITMLKEIVRLKEEILELYRKDIVNLNSKLKELSNGN